jgi:hypothetical protein
MHILKTIGFNGVSANAIYSLMPTNFDELDNTEYAKAIDKFLTSTLRLYPSLDFMAQKMVSKSTGNLYNTANIKSRKRNKVDFVKFLPMTSILSEAVAKDLGMYNQNTVIGPDFHRYFVFSKCNELNDIMEVKLRDTKYVERLQGSAYNKSSRWLRRAKAAVPFKLHTFLAYLDDYSPSGLKYAKLKRAQNYMYRLAVYANKYLPMPNMGDYTTAYIMEGMPAASVELVDAGDVLNLDEATVLQFEEYLNSELDAIAEWENEVRTAIVKAVPSLRKYNSIEALIAAYEALSPEEQQLHPPIGLVDRYHYSMKWIEENGTKTKFKYKFDGKGKKLRYFTFMGTVDEVKKLSIADRRALIQQELRRKVSNSLALAENLGIISIEDYVRGSNENLLDRGDSLFANNRGVTVSEDVPRDILDVWRKTYKDRSEHWLAQNDGAAIVAAIASASINDMITTLEFERAVMGDIAFYKSFDDRNARYQAILSTGSSVVTGKGKPFRVFNAAAIFHSLDDFISFMRSSYVEMYEKLLNDPTVAGKRTVYNEGMSLKPEDFTAEAVYKKAEELAETALSQFKNVNTYDGYMGIMPDMYSSIYSELGMWSLKKDIDMARMYRNYTDAASNTSLSIQPLKMSYSSIHFNGNLSYPVYWKPALFPIFRNSVGMRGEAQKLFEFLNRNKLDGIVFDAIKLGVQPAGSVRDEDGNFDFSTIEQTKGLINAYTQNLDFQDWRHQSYTEHHVQKDRTMGVQIDREVMEGMAKNENTFVVDDRTAMTGKEMFDQWCDLHNKLTDIQYDKVEESLGLKVEAGAEATQVGVAKALFANMSNNSTLSLEEQMRVIETTDEHGNTTEKLNLNINSGMASNQLLNSVTGKIGRDLLRLKLPGTEMIQSPAYGAPSKFMRDLYDLTGQLKFRDEEGRMEVAVGVEVFKHIIPNYK